MKEHPSLLLAIMALLAALVLILGPGFITSIINHHP